MVPSPPAATSTPPLWHARSAMWRAMAPSSSAWSTTASSNSRPAALSRSSMVVRWSSVSAWPDPALRMIKSGAGMGRADVEFKDAKLYHQRQILRFQYDSAQAPQGEPILALQGNTASPSARAQIILMRHGKPLLGPGGSLPLAAMPAWIAAYDLAGIAGEAALPAPPMAPAWRLHVACMWPFHALAAGAVGGAAAPAVDGGLRQWRRERAGNAPARA